MANPLESFKKLPTWGKVGVLAGGGAVTFYAWKQHQASKAASTSTTQTGTDPVTGLPYSEDNQTDPQTGLTYLAEAQQYGSVSAAETALSGNYASSNYPNGSYGASPVYSTGSSLGTTGVGTNAAWSQEVQSGLSGVGYDPVTIAAALGAYLTNSPLTSDQAAIVQAAIAEYGPPPVGTYTITLASSTGTATTGNTSTGSTSTGTGSSSDTGSTSTDTGSSGGTTTVTTPSKPATATVSGGHVVSVNNNDAVIAWTGHNAVKYTVKINGPGALNGRTNTVGIAQATYSGLEAGHTYDVTVTPYNSAGQAGQSGVITFVTK